MQKNERMSYRLKTGQIFLFKLILLDLTLTECKL